MRRLAVCAVLLASCSGGSEPSETELTLLALDPNAVHPGVGSVVVVAHGAGFQDGAVVEREGAALETNFVSGARLAALLPFEAVELPDTFTVRVRNPDGEVSNDLPFIVSPEARGSTEQEVVQQASAHARDAPQITEMPPELAAKVKAAIRRV